MPNIEANGISIYYEYHPATQAVHDPTPLLLIMGLGISSLGWHKNLPGLTLNHNVIVFDNRGTGRSSKPDQPYSIRQMATDTAKLLEALQIRRVHLFGYSMGSMIAQEVALNYPHKVKSLILGASTLGGWRSFMTRPSIGLAMLQRASASSTNDLLTPILYSPEFIRKHPEEIAADMRLRKLYPTPLYAYRHQLLACAQHDTYSRLDQLQMPTLVFTGTADRLVLPENSKILARRIPRAELVLVAGYGHLLPSENPPATNQIVLDFLKRKFPLNRTAVA
jgi:pimeloyl-ACP methyl ester carboxylesterase